MFIHEKISIENLNADILTRVDDPNPKARVLNYHMHGIPHDLGQVFSTAVSGIEGLTTIDLSKIISKPATINPAAFIPYIMPFTEGLLINYLDNPSKGILLSGLEFYSQDTREVLWANIERNLVLPIIRNTQMQLPAIILPSIVDLRYRQYEVRRLVRTIAVMPAKDQLDPIDNITSGIPFLKSALYKKYPVHLLKNLPNAALLAANLLIKKLSLPNLSQIASASDTYKHSASTLNLLSDLFSFREFDAHTIVELLKYRDITLSQTRALLIIKDLLNNYLIFWDAEKRSYSVNEIIRPVFTNKYLREKIIDSGREMRVQYYRDMVSTSPSNRNTYVLEYIFQMNDLSVEDNVIQAEILRILTSYYANRNKTFIDLASINELKQKITNDSDLPENLKTKLNQACVDFMQVSP